jgi:hypothetical protein
VLKKRRSRIVATPVLATALAIITVAPASAAPISCGVPTTGKVVELKQDLSCPGDGIVVGGDEQEIRLNGHTIFGSFSGVGIDFNGHSAVSVEGGGARVLDFGTGVVLDGRLGTIEVPGQRLPRRVPSSIGRVQVEFPTGDGIQVPVGRANVFASAVTVSNAGANGVHVFGGDGSKEPIPKVALFGINVFSSTLNGISIDKGSNTTVADSVSKQNGADGIVVNPQPNGGSVGIENTRANYNVGWGINGIRGVRSAGNTAVGNGQVRQCHVVECN